jgi:broad specificity phosphatase PhoE
MSDKTVFFIRHGQGHHNVAGDVDYANYMKEEYFDAGLTETGWSQVRSLKGTISVDLVVVSPLTRALQTATGVFQDCSTPILAHELCREHLGVHPCDRRRTRTEYERAFPSVDFSLITDDMDVLWKSGVREKEDEIQKRIWKFLRWLSARPEKSIAVVGHGSFFHAMWRTHYDGEELPWPSNCEIRKMTLDTIRLALHV